MKAIVVENSGKIEDFVESDVDKSKVNDDDVLIEVHAMSINPVDGEVRREEQSIDAESPFILGADISGVVSEIGKDVTEFSPGDEVFAKNDMNRSGGGGLAEFVSVPKENIVKKPAEISFEEASTLGIAALTGYQLVNKNSYQIKKGEKVFIQGGSGGVGVFAIQFAKQNGAYVIATTSRNESLLESLKVDEVVNYKEVDVPKEFSNQVDMLIDTAGVGTESLPVVKNGGRALTPTTPIAEEKASERNITVDRILYETDTEQMKKFADQVASGELKIIIDEVFPFTQNGVQDAYELSESGHAAGKIVVKIK